MSTESQQDYDTLLAELREATAAEAACGRELAKAHAQLRKSVVVVDDAAITRAANAIGALGTDRIGAESYAAARTILNAARGIRVA